MYEPSFASPDSSTSPVSPAVVQYRNQTFGCLIVVASDEHRARCSNGRHKSTIREFPASGSEGGGEKWSFLMGLLVASSIVQQDVPSSTIQALPPLPMGDLASPSAVTDVHTNDSVVDIGWKSSVLKFLIGATVLLAALVAAAKGFG